MSDEEPLPQPDTEEIKVFWEQIKASDFPGGDKWRLPWEELPPEAMETIKELYEEALKMKEILGQDSP